MVCPPLSPRQLATPFFRISHGTEMEIGEMENGCVAGKIRFLVFYRASLQICRRKNRGRRTFEMVAILVHTIVADAPLPGLYLIDEPAWLDQNDHPQRNMKVLIFGMANLGAPLKTFI